MITYITYSLADIKFSSIDKILKIDELAKAKVTVISEYPTID